MGQKNAKAKIIYGEDKIIRMKHELGVKRFPGGIGTRFFHKMKEYENNVAQFDGPTGKAQTYGELLQHSVRTAIEMRSRGIKSKDIVTICSHNHLDTVVPLYATFFLGAIPASLDPTLSLADISILIKQVKPKMFFVSEAAVKLIEDALENIGHEAEIVVFGETDRHTKFSVFVEEKEKEKEFLPENKVDDLDTAIIFFSSGTTGLPKGICLTHFSLLNHMEYYIGAVDCNVVLAYSSLYWISAIGLIAMTTISGGARVIAKEFQPEATWNYIEKYKISLVFLTVNASRDFCRFGRPSGINTSSLKIYYTGGEKVPASLLQDLQNVLPGTFVTQAYGQTEVSGCISAFDADVPEDVEMSITKPESCGKPVIAIDEYKIVDLETGESLGPNKPGELRVKSKLLMKGYHNLESSDAFDENGYLKTGDVVYYDEDFCFFVIDRIKEMLKYRSWHVAPAMLEEVLLTHPAVHAAVVVGIPDKEDGEHPRACVILKQGIKGVQEEEIRKYVDERVDDRKKLRGGVVFVKSFPITASGKVSRRLLKNLWHQTG